MRAIVVAAGAGRRLGEHTRDRPKGLVEVAGRSLYDRQIEAFRRVGVTDIVVVRGYHGEQLERQGLRFVENPQWAENNVLASLFCAEHAMEGGFLFAYGDILYDAAILDSIIGATDPIALAVDTDWQRTYNGERINHPVEAAELLWANSDFQVTRIGIARIAGVKGALGEFMGLARFDACGAQSLRHGFADARARVSDDAPYGFSPSLRKAYLTDLLQDLVVHGVVMRALPFAGRWIEIDTPEDLAYARRMALEASWLR